MAQNFSLARQREMFHDFVDRHLFGLEGTGATTQPRSTRWRASRPRTGRSPSPGTRPRRSGPSGPDVQPCWWSRSTPSSMRSSANSYSNWSSQPEPMTESPVVDADPQHARTPPANLTSSRRRRPAGRQHRARRHSRRRPGATGTARADQRRLRRRRDVRFQIAKSLGADVTGVCSARNLDLARSIGANRVIDYTHEDFTTNGQRYDVVLDLVGNRTLTSCDAR